MISSIRQFPIGVGVSEDGDPKTLPPGSLLSLSNGVWLKDGRVDKRFGTAGKTKNIVSGGALSAARRLLVRDTELALTDGLNLYTLTAAGWQLRGKHPELGLDWLTSTDTAAGVQASDVTLLANGQVVETWVSGDPAENASGTLYYQIREPASGAIVQPPTLLEASVWPAIRVVSSGNTWVILYTNAAGKLQCATSTGVTTLRTDAATTFAGLDAMVLGANFVVAYGLASNQIRLALYTVATTPVAGTTQLVATVTPTAQTISVAGAVGETLYVAWLDANNGKVQVYGADPAALTQTFAAVTVETIASASDRPKVGAVRESATSCLLVYSVGANNTGTSYKNGITKTASVSSGGAVTAGQLTLFLTAMSRPFLIGSRFYCVLGLYNFAQNANGSAQTLTNSDTFLAEVTRVTSSEPFRLVGKIDCLIGGQWGKGFLPNAVASSATLTVFPAPFQSTPPTGAAGVRQGVRYVRCTSGASVPADMWRCVSLTRESYLAAGVLTSYDGVDALGYGYPHGPYLDAPHTQAGGSGTGAMAAGNYTYNVTAERRSAVGILHRSPVGLPITVVASATGSVTVGVIPASLGHSANIRGHFPLHRTTVNGTIPQRIAMEPSFMTVQDAGLTDPVTVLDTSADGNVNGVSLSQRPALYTAGGELEDTQPVASLTVCLHRNRLWSLAGDKRTGWVSKDATVNPGVAPGFHPTQIITFPEDVVAFASMDDKLIALGSSKPYYLLGDGPDPTGGQSDYGAPTPIQSDAGCINPRSVVATPDGLMFLTARGFYLLSRGLELAYVGKPVQDTLAAFPNITSAVLVPQYNEVRWTCNNAAGTAGRVIVFDYRTKQWATRSYYDADAAVSGTPFADAVLWNGVWTFVTPAGKVYVEDPTTYLDNGATWVTLSGEIAWIAEGGPTGFQHIRRAALLGDKLTDCDLTLKFRFNHSASYVQSYTWTSDKLAAFGDGPNVAMRVGSQNGASPRNRAFALAWSDAAPSGPGAVVGNGQGINLSAIGIEFMVKPGMDRRSPNART